MAMTSYALGLYKDYTKVRVALGRYKAGSTYKTVPIDSVGTLKDGRLAFFMTIPPGDSTGSTVTEVALLDRTEEKAQEAGGRSSTGSPAAACHLHHDAPIRDMEQIYRGNRRNDRQLHEVCGGQAVQIGLLAFLHNRGLTIIYASRSGAAAGTTLPTRACSS